MTLDELMDEMLKDENVKREYDALEPEFQIIHAMLDARLEEDLTQQQLADRMGIDRADISKLCAKEVMIQCRQPAGSSFRGITTE